MIDWNNNENTSLTSVTVFGVAVRAGDRVRLWPQKSADIIDIALKGKVAVVEAIESDFDNQVHVAVVLDDDPGRDLGILRQPGHRFFFSPEEIEPLTLGGEVAHDR
jgi:ABC-type Fe3+ transport system substrate-binding protein